MRLDEQTNLGRASADDERDAVRNAVSHTRRKQRQVAIAAPPPACIAERSRHIAIRIEADRVGDARERREELLEPIHSRARAYTLSSVSAKTAFLPLASGWSDLVGHHRTLLDDDARTDAFVRAIRKVVKRGDVVADLGAGTGVLSIAARRAGAARVYAIERGPIARVGQALTAENRVSDITWIEGHSREVVLPEPVDVIVSECFGVLAAGGTMLQAVNDLRRRHLKADGRVVPRAVTIFAAPVEAPLDHRWVARWAERRHGMTFRAAADLAFNNMYSTQSTRRALLSEPLRVGDVDFARGRFEGDASSIVRRAGTVHGLVAWFDADLAPGITLSTAPGKPTTVWRQVFLPFPKAIRVRRGSRVRVALRMEPGPTTELGNVAFLDWSGEIAGTSFDGSTRRSYPNRFEKKPFAASS